MTTSELTSAKDSVFKYLNQKLVPMKRQATMAYFINFFTFILVGCLGAREEHTDLILFDRISMTQENLSNLIKIKILDSFVVVAVSVLVAVAVCCCGCGFSFGCS